MIRVKKDCEELEAIVLTELRQVPHCEDARSVEATWTVSFFDPGESGEQSCEEALWAIVPRLQQQFDLGDD